MKKLNPEFIKDFNKYKAQIKLMDEVEKELLQAKKSVNINQIVDKNDI
jgi:hypothetical protein